MYVLMHANTCMEIEMYLWMNRNIILFDVFIFVTMFNFLHRECRMFSIL